MSNRVPQARKRVAVIGTGFGAVAAVRRLRALDKNIEITVVGRKAEFVFNPSLIWVPTGLREGPDLVVPLDPLFRRLDVDFRAAEATGLAENGRVVLTSSGPIANDGLVIASGGCFIKTLPGIEHAFIPCEGIEAVQRIRDRIENLDRGTLAFGFSSNPEEPAAVRASPIFEFLFGIDTHLRRNRRRGQFKLVFFHPSAEPATGLGDKAMGGLLAEMKRRDIEAHLGHELKAFSETGVSTEGSEFPADLIVFMPGVTGGAWLDNTTLPRSPGGLVQGDMTCRVPGCPAVYVAGDVGSFPGPDWLPKLGHMADLQATTAAENLLAELAGREPKETFKSELMCIIDSMDRGTFVMRTLDRSMVTPQLKVLHTSKNWFEWYYLRQLR